MLLPLMTAYVRTYVCTWYIGNDDNNRMFITCRPLSTCPVSARRRTHTYIRTWPPNPHGVMVDLSSLLAIRLAPFANTDVGGVDTPGVAEGMGPRVL